MYSYSGSGNPRFHWTELLLSFYTMTVMTRSPHINSQLLAFLCNIAYIDPSVVSLEIIASQIELPRNMRLRAHRSKGKKGPSGASETGTAADLGDTLQSP